MTLRWMKRASPNVLKTKVCYAKDGETEALNKINTPSKKNPTCN